MQAGIAPDVTFYDCGRCDASGTITVRALEPEDVTALERVYRFARIIGNLTAGLVLVSTNTGAQTSIRDAVGMTGSVMTHEDLERLAALIGDGSDTGGKTN